MMTDDANGGVHASHPRSSRVALRPIYRSDYDFLYELASAPDVLWQWRGRAVGPETFQASLYADVLAHFVIVGAADNLIGYVSCYGANLVHGTASVQLFLGAPYRGIGWPIEAGALFVDYLFETFPLRKLYGESPAYYFERLKSATQVGLTIEGCFRDHVYGRGRYWDVYVLALTRESWEQRRRLLRGLGLRERRHDLRT